ncbi:MAG TPA: capsular biosynthesis protein [Sedimenticola thiotaurini]|uniref:Capsular biosynthesis protein n=1 Tax=Sedimenticola thiotaurini TaxID=1543721 RepID=A0A831RKN4_9GAMM|nr:capsular biosynthesis protein [Sedimenticola thiotaurini]
MVTDRTTTPRRRTFLFLQGPITPFFRLVGDGLEARGHRVRRIDLCFGDQLFWRRPGATHYRGRLAGWPAFIDGYLQREGVTDLILLGEQRAYHRAAIEAARRHGIQVVATDFGYLRPDWITFEQDGMSGESRFPRTPAAIEALAARCPRPELSRRFRDSFPRQVIWDMAYHLSSSLLRPLYPFYRSHQIYHPILVYLGTGLHLLRARLGAAGTERAIRALIGADVPYYLFPLQMQNDFQLRAYSPYPDMRTPIREVMASFARAAPAGARLAIKVHPLDPGMVNWRRFCRGEADRLGLGERVVFIDGGSLERLLDHARGVVTINSTVGVWTLLAGRPLKTLGDAVYDVPGLTFQGGLDPFWTEAAAPDAGLRDAFVRALAGTIQLRGVYYNQPGLDAAVAEAVERLDRNLINEPLPREETHG